MLIAATVYFKRFKVISPLFSILRNLSSLSQACVKVLQLRPRCQHPLHLSDIDI